MREALAKLC